MAHRVINSCKQLLKISRRGLALRTIRMHIPVESISEADIVEVKHSVGDFLKQDTVVVVADAKVEINVSTPDTGRLVEVYVKDGDKVKQNVPLFKIKTASFGPDIE